MEFRAAAHYLEAARAGTFWSISRTSFSFPNLPHDFNTTIADSCLN